MFAQLGVITRATFFEIVAGAERYLIINPYKNKKSKKQPLWIYVTVKLDDGKMSAEKEKIYSYLIYNHDILSKMAGKTEPISGKISWIWTCVKFLENLLLLKQSTDIFNDVK